MPSTPLYTVIAHENGTVTFELSEELFQQALKEVETQRTEIDAQFENLQTARNNQYQLFLMENLPKEGEAAPVHAIYLGKDDYIIYDDYITKAGMKRQLRTYPKDWPGVPSEDDLKKADIKSTILDALIGEPKVGTPSSVTLEKYVDAYLKAYHTFRVNNTRPRVSAEYYITVTSEEFYAWKNKSYDAAPYKNIVIKSPDKQIRDINLRSGSPSWYKEAMPEFYRYTVSEQNGQVTLKMDIAQNTPGARTGLKILKQYATNLLHTLGITEQDKQRYPKIEVAGEGTKALYQEKEEHVSHDMEVALYVSVLMFIGGAVAIAVSLATAIPGGIFLLGLGIFAMLAGAVGVGSIGMMFSSPKKDLAWHENDLAYRYKHYFLTRSDSTNKPEVMKPMLLAPNGNAEASATSEPTASPVTSTSASTPTSISSSDQKLRGR
jgi:hypothetical protein